MLLIALDMLVLIGDGEQMVANYGEHDWIATGDFPIAVPLFAGPGAINTVIIDAHNPNTRPYHNLQITMNILTASALIAGGLLATSVLSRLLTPVARNVMNKLPETIVCALGVEIIQERLAGFFVLPNGTSTES